MTDKFTEHRIRHVAAFQLPFQLSRALWLVDVCRSSYKDAAAELGIDESEFSRRVIHARRAIRVRVCPPSTRAAQSRGTRRVRSAVAHGRARFALAIVPLAAVFGCGGDSSAEVLDVGHVHDFVEHDDDLLLGTHQGIVRLEGDRLERVGDEVHDIMSLARLGSGTLVASGHPDLRIEKYRVEGSPPYLGLVRSSDGGENWDIVDLLGEVDFHALAPSGDKLYGGASSGMIWEFLDAGSAGHPLGGVEQDLRDLAASPDVAELLITTSFDGRVALSADAAQTWEFLTDVPAFIEVEWTADRIAGVDLEDVIWAATDVAGPYRELGVAPDETDAFFVDSDGELWLATHDGSIWKSSDGSDWTVVRSGRQ